jgi:hypothetical protein
MPENDKFDPYDTFKKMGLTLEQQINELFYNIINKEEILQLISLKAQSTADSIEMMQKYVESLSVPLNFPTKNDVTYIAKLAVENEEKLDRIQEQVLSLTETVEQINQTLSMPTKITADTKKANQQLSETIKVWLNPGIRKRGNRLLLSDSK